MNGISNLKFREAAIKGLSIDDVVKFDNYLLGVLAARTTTEGFQNAVGYALVLLDIHHDQTKQAGKTQH